MTSEEKRLDEANRAFYRAFESRELAKMEMVWADGEEVKCVHPGWPLLTGRREVMRSWERIFKGTRYIEFKLTNVSVNVHGSLGWVLCQEDILTNTGGPTYQSAVLSTNVFELHEGGWRLAHHHGSQISQEAMPPE